VSSSYGVYYVLYAGLLAAVGAVGVLVVGRTLVLLGRPNDSRLVILALLALSPIAFGSVALTRFDLLPATLTAIATLLVVAGRLRGAGVVLGAAIATKLYPAVLLPLLVALAWRRHGRREAAGVTAITVGVVVVAYLPFLLLDAGGVAASIERQLERPLHVESIGAGVLLALHHLAGLALQPEMSSGSTNLEGTASTPIAAVSSVLQAVVVAALCVRFVTGPATVERFVRYAAAVLLAFVALGKVLSPQFLLWLLFPLALQHGRRGAAAGALVGLAVVTTAAYFPFRFKAFEAHLDGLTSSLILLRDVALVAALAVLVWPPRATGRAAPRSRSPSPSTGRR
jgi:hypothetical protein